MVHRALARRFGEPDAILLDRIRRLPPDALVDLMDVVIDAPALHVVVAQVDAQLA